MTDLDELQDRLLDRYNCQDVVEFAHYHPVAHEALVELRKARATIERVREAADKYAGAKWRDTPMLSVEYAEGLNQAGDEILDILDGGK